MHQDRSQPEGIRMVRGLIRNQMPVYRLRVRVPCPPLDGVACPGGDSHRFALPDVNQFIAVLFAMTCFPSGIGLFAIGAVF
jgi:hypothetical protein